MVEALKHFPRSAYLLRKLTGRILHQAELELEKITLGNEFASHTIPAELLNDRSVVYSFGVGTDASFDLDVIRRYGCSVHGFDPTPRSMAWVKSQNLPERFVFHPIGIGETDEETPFSPPERETHVSYSRSRDSAGAVELPVRRLSSIMRELHHSRIDLLKLDVEGFEYGVLRDMLASKIIPVALAVEFHHRMYGYHNSDTQDAVAELRSAGYRLFHVSESGREYSFMLKQ